MAATTLSVTVFGGTPPFSILIRLKKGSELIKEFKKDGSFEHTFLNLTGKYSLIISGTNPMNPDSKTILKTSTDEIKLAPESDPNPCTRKGKSYLVQYVFTTK
jgi:hypothetical protein